MFIVGCIYKYIEYCGVEKEWGDGICGLFLNVVCYVLLCVEYGFFYIKNWRFQVLVMLNLDVEQVVKYFCLLFFMLQLKVGKGLIIVGLVLEGMYLDKYMEVQWVEENIWFLMSIEKIKGFCQLVVLFSLWDGMFYLIQLVGLGGLKYNMVFMVWFVFWKQEDNFFFWKNFVDIVCDIIVVYQVLLVVKNVDLFL